MGALPSAVTSAEPEWLPKRILAGSAVAADPREAHLFDTRRITRGLSVREVAWSPDGSFVVVVAKRPEEAKLVVLKLPLGKSFREVEPETISLAGDTPSSVAVSTTPSGEARIIYISAGGLVEVGPNGRRRIETAPFVPINVAVEPMTAELYMVAKHPQGVGLVRAQPDGSAGRLLVTEHVEPGSPSLSADRGYVVVSASADKSGDAGLLLTSTEGGQIRRLAGAGNFASRSSTFHPGGRLLAFSSSRDRKDGELYIIQWAGDARVERVTFMQGDAPAFSPDGRSLAFTSVRGKSETADLYIARFLEEP